MLDLNEIKLIPAQSSDIAFAKSVHLQNMKHYYNIHNICWDDSQFEQNWPTTSNFLIVLDHAVGIFRFSSEGTTFRIRDIQLLHQFQGKGIGSTVLARGQAIATEQCCNKVRLQVFAENPATKLYKKEGFLIVESTPPFFQMEKNLWRQSNFNISSAKEYLAQVLASCRASSAIDFPHIAGRQSWLRQKYRSYLLNHVAIHNH